ncbi:hypothetical protein O181_086245 [Austropuccinia psidii MF-1]|uniref:Uncharacterized protein n=1 Tax=Austropuccinia psidii MF-1 TaxID=1389203 RepID=A0A9Q3FYZ0_9BASI|nr:hypothetical protein [Austropuccinia psidii MF-1]
MYGIDLHNKKHRYFTIGDSKHQKFSFLPLERQIEEKKVSQVKLELENLNSEQINEDLVSLHLTDIQEIELSIILYDHKEAFAIDEEPLGGILGH